jgi:hypothetical protein
MIGINSGGEPTMKEDKQKKLYKLYRHILALMLVVGLAGCATSSVESRYSYDRNTDFSTLNSYAWLPGDEGSFSTPESAIYFRNTMDEVLAEMGFNLNPDVPDFLIKTLDVRSYVEKYKTYAGNFDVPKELIHITFSNPSSNKEIYDTVASVIFDADMDQASKNAVIDRVVKSILADFPPES